MRAEGPAPQAPTIINVPEAKVVYEENPVNVAMAEALVRLVNQQADHLETLVRGVLAENLAAWDRSEQIAQRPQLERERTLRRMTVEDRIAEQAAPEPKHEPDLMPSDLA